MSQGLSLGHGRFRSVIIRRSMAETQRIRVLVVDDHRMFTDALTAVLDQDGRFEVVGTAATGPRGGDGWRRLPRRRSS